MVIKENTKNYQKSSRERPRVSIGMPVFNGEKYLEEAIDSILAQTYKNFELIISDNASTDNTQKICLDYVKRDPRVHYYRNSKNLGGPSNYNRVFELSSCEYFKWAASDDLHAPEFLRKCVSVLDNNPLIIGCHCKTGKINQDGDLLDYYNQGLLKRINSLKPHERFRDLIGLYYTTTLFYGLYRTSIFSKTPRQGSYIGADRNLLAELGLIGRIYELSDCLFFWRDHPDSYTTIFYGSEKKDTLDRLQKAAAWWSKGNLTYFPHWKNCAEYYISVNRVSLSWFEKLVCYLQIFGWIFEEGHRFMTNDIIVFLLQNSSFARNLLPFFSLVPGSIFKIIKK